jgi:Arm DNA-binding domain
MSTVYIEKHDGRLRLRWFHGNKRYMLAVGVDDNATGRAIARKKAGQIETDIAAGYFDPTLLKYRPQQPSYRNPIACWATHRLNTTPEEFNKMAAHRCHH